MEKPHKKLDVWRLAMDLVLRPPENEGLSLRAQRSNLGGGYWWRDCFVAALLAMTPQNHPDGLLVTAVYEATEKFPREERYSLTDQVRQATVSTPSNIAEGAASKPGRSS